MGHGELARRRVPNRRDLFVKLIFDLFDRRVHERGGCGRSFCSTVSVILPAPNVIATLRKPWGDGVTEKLAWHVVKEFAARTGVTNLAPHDLRRTCARLCRAAGGELEQIQFLPGHISVQTTERYLGCAQRIASAVNDKIGIEPAR